ncbi:isoprenylcysteine carboxylmethyltransferase family protein [Hyphomicrobium sp.]|uniref:methyltransferase family protein n=1 Tax=Hyphomicrobium sp. TaxID=82 RepID=UPI002D7A25A6|nr:isoprenylcysteine carboxylmethyltransferase family protein [Hyphomicrobium sp.]HET6389896.1 isoprenylcysteine carboxylmethyltransferase family protein [Hyphomicrobium sp.]
MTEPNTSASSVVPETTVPWPPLLLAVVAVLAWALTVWAPLPWTGTDDSPARWLGWAFGILGLLLIVFAMRALVQHRTTIMPNKTPTTLVTTGPYVRFRNPIYLGEVLLLLYAAEITKSLWFVAAAAVFAVLVTALQIIPEERRLEAIFGDAYRDYKSRTRRWI